MEKINSRVEYLIKYFGDEYVGFLLGLTKEELCKCNYQINPNQIIVIDILKRKINSEILMNIEKDYFFDSVYCTVKWLVDPKYMNTYRLKARCDGNRKQNIRLFNDELKDALARRCFELYPSLLMKENSTFLYSSISLNEIRRILINDDISKLIKKDKKDKEKLLIRTSSNRKIEGYYCETSIDFFDNFIQNCYMNCQYKLTVTLDDLILEVVNSIDKLRSLANNREVKCSIFIGISEYAFQGFEVLDLGNLIIRQININSPSCFRLGIVPSIDNNNGESIVSGVIAESINEIKRLNIPKSKYNEYSKDFDEIADSEGKRKVRNFNLATIFTLGELQSFSSCIMQTGFWLKRSYHEVNKNCSGRGIKIDKKQIEDIEYWYKKISNNSKIENVFTNLKEAIIDNKGIEDQIMNAFYAWEGMFNDKDHVTISVVNSISIYLNYKKEEIEKLYDTVRSYKVHGKSIKMPIDKNINQVKKDVCSIAIECTKKLLEDNELIGLKPSKRVKKILGEKYWEK